LSTTRVALKQSNFSCVWVGYGKQLTLNVGCDISIKKRNLFILFVTLRDPKPLYPPCAHGIIGKPLISTGVGLVVFRLMVQELLNIEYFFSKKIL
jgi:hypothetical protein